MTAEEVLKIIKTVVASLVAAVSALYLVYNLTAMILRFEIQFEDRLDENEAKSKANDARIYQLEHQAKQSAAHRQLQQRQIDKLSTIHANGDSNGE